jgi:nucleoside-diphosphate-sugar epimerase
MDKKVVVTGGCGFIGSHLVESLVKKNYEVTVFDNLSTGFLHNLDNVKKDIKFIRGDIRNYKEVFNALKGAEIVFHLAALSYVGESIRIPEEYNKVNIDGTLNVLKACKENNVQRYIFPSSCIVYGNPEKNPVSEDSPLKPNSPYGITKMAGEFYAQFFNKEYGLETFCLRIFNAFGPRMKKRVISIFAESIFKNRPINVNGNGEQIRDFIFVSDIVNAFICAMKAKKNKCGKSYNVGTGKGTTLNTLIKKITSITGINGIVNYRKNVSSEIYELIADTNLSKKEIGFSARVELEEGLKRLLVSFKKEFK